MHREVYCPRGDCDTARLFLDWCPWIRLPDIVHRRLMVGGHERKEGRDLDAQVIWVDTRMKGKRLSRHRKNKHTIITISESKLETHI